VSIVPLLVPQERDKRLDFGADHGPRRIAVRRE